jgi:Mg-chelatase subunit ChlD
MSDGPFRALLRPAALVRLAIAIGAAIAIWILIDKWIGDRTSIHVDWVGDRPIDLLAPQWLHLVAIVPAFYVIRVLSLTDLSVLQQVVQASLRSLVIVGVAVALARPSWVTETSKVATVVLVDVSDSISDKQLDAAKQYVDDLAKAESDGNLQLITFAEKPTTMRKPDGKPLSTTIARHAQNGAGTDIQAAMQLAYGLYPDGYVPRMVIISDGNQTAGDVAVEAYRARELGVKVSWRTFDQDPTPEVRVVGVTVPDEIKTDQPYEVTAEVWTTQKQTVTLALQHDEFPNALEPSKTLELREGKNIVKFKSVTKAGQSATTYTLRLTKYEHDTELKNNTAVMSAPVKAKPSVLYVEGSRDREPGSATYLTKALQHEGIDVSERGPAGIPSNPKELEKYDLVIVSDVPAYLMGAGQMAALDNYVAGMGGGLVMAGGPDSFGSGGYERTRIEQMMPVRFDSEKIKEQPDVALVLVIDRSGSMQGQKLEAAKDSARASAEVLSPNDYIAVVAFDSEATVLVRPTRASNKTRISADISRLQAGGGTNIYPGLKEAFDILQQINAKVKHVILMTDGEAPLDGLAELVQDMRASRITVSCVGVQGADRNMLNMIAENGEGRVWMVDDIGSMPKIFMQETQEAQRSQLVEDTVKVRVAKRVEMIEGTSVETSPPLHGYVSTKPKPTSETVLISDLGEPILARWRYGAGTTVAWTSDVKSRWSSEWIRWNGYPKFWAQVVRSTMRRKTYDSYEMFAKVADGRIQITVDAVDSGDHFVNGLETELHVIDPATNKDISRPLAMEQTAAGRYSVDFKPPRYGSYLLTADHKRDGKMVAQTRGAAGMPYPLEYLKSTPDTEPLKHAASVSGGHDQATPPQVWSADGEHVSYTQDLWPYVLLGVVALFLLDLYAKRVRLFGYRTIRFD